MAVVFPLCTTWAVAPSLKLYFHAAPVRAYSTLSMTWALNGSEKCRPDLRPVKSSTISWLPSEPASGVRKRKPSTG